MRATNRSSRRAATSAAVQQVVCKGFAVVPRRFSVIMVPPQAEHDLPLVYDPDRVVEYVRRRPWLVVARVSQVLHLLLQSKYYNHHSEPPVLHPPQITAACTQYLSFKLQQGASERLKGLLPEQAAQREDPSAARQEGQLICNLLTGLGPTFVKLGQILSVRPDVVGEQLSQDLAQLQVRVAHPHPALHSPSPALAQNAGARAFCFLNDLAGPAEPVTLPATAWHACRQQW